MDVASSSDDLDQIPNTCDDIWSEILLRVPTRDLEESCIFVCKQWHDLIKIKNIWKRKCIQGMEHPYERNLIKNPDASKVMMEWEVIRNGGNGWSVETEPNGSDPVSDFNNECKGSVGCWASSYGECAKYQVVDLMAEDCSKYVLDHFRPAIHVSEWYSARRDCGAVYKMTVELMSEKTEEFWTASPENTNTTYSFDVTLPDGSGAWFQAMHTFKDYPMGIRYVGFYHSGKDTNYWAGNFGAKMTLSSVILDFKHVAGPAKRRDDDV